MDDVFFLTRESIQDFLIFLRKKKRKAGTLATYETTLLLLYCYLSPEKEMHKDTIREWQQNMLKNGYSPHTIESRTSIANRFMAYLGKPEWRAQLSTATVPPDLTRADYRSLLETAQESENHTAYLMIKTLCCTGMSFRQLSQLTVLSLQSYSHEFPSCVIHPGKDIYIPPFLRAELLEYSQTKGSPSDLVFVNERGEGYCPEDLYSALKPVFLSAGISVSKLTSRAFQKLYHSVFDKIYYQYISQVSDTYTDYLLEEENIIRWKEPVIHDIM